MKKLILFLSLFAFCMFTQAQRKTKIVETVKQEAPDAASKVIKRKVAIGRFSNETQYAKGIFYDKENDPMGKQALDILSAKLAASGKFLLLERSDLATLLEEAQKSDNGLATIVDVSTGLIIYSDEGKGSAELTTRTTMGVGGKADYDATLSDKAISEAIGQLVENIINKCTNKPWRTFFLSYDNDTQLIAGGASQGITVGDKFTVKTKGKKVKNPQTGVMIELPGKTLGTVTVTDTAGDTPETEYSFVTFAGNGSNIDAEKLTDYYIEEIKK